MQKYWLNEQKELVKLTREREEQITSLDTLQKQIIIMQQRKLRVESTALPASALKCSSVKGGKRAWRVTDGKSWTCPSERSWLCVSREPTAQTLLLIARCYSCED